MNSFCTIITANYLPKAVALYKSIVRYDANVKLYVLVTENKPTAPLATSFEGIEIMYVSDLERYPLVNELYKKYAHIDLDFFRWSLKPVLINYLLEKKVTKILYVDCDMFFVNDYQFLFDDLDQSSVLLTPHWKNSDPLENSESFFELFRSGIFTAGFIGANRQAIPALQWWANACHFMMGEHPSLSIHDDQRYLDIFPVYFEGIKIIRHQGCTVGAWSYEHCKRTLVNNEVLINNKYPIIFIHFDNMLVSQILKGYDPLLLPYLNDYQKVFSESGSDLADFLDNIQTYAKASMIKKFKWKFRIRTRIKRFFYYLARSI